MTEAAEMLGVDVKTLRNWKKSSHSKQIGRPKAEVSLGEIFLIAREWRRQGCKGSRPIIAALPWIRVRLVREVIAGLKKKRNVRRERQRAKTRISIQCIYPGVLHTLDGAETPEKQQLIVGKDRKSQLIRVQKAKRTLDESETLNYLRTLEAEGSLPLVLGSDNGSQFCSKAVGAYLNEKQIVHLRSLPRTPQHNGACEIAVREVKETLAHIKCLDQAVTALNKGLKRRELGYKTAVEIEQQNRISYTHEQRGNFYVHAQIAIQQRTYGINDARRTRKAEREAILQTLESFKLAKIIRGNQNQISKRENNL